jgi:predicted phosphodiesterase
MKMRMMIKKRYLVISDLQIPYHHEAAVKNLIKLVKREKFDLVLNTGDELDMQSQSKWAKGTHLEYEGQLDADRSLAQNILWDLGTTDITRSNHTDRLYHTLVRGAPSLIGLPELNYANFMGFNELGIRFHKKPYEFHKGWVLVHGDEGSMNSNAGLTALGLARKFGKSVVCGHTHRAGISAFTEGIGASYRTLWGLEAGNVMDKKKASYLKAGSANWQMSVAIIETYGDRVSLMLIPINRDGSFTVYGKLYATR